MLKKTLFLMCIMTLASACGMNGAAPENTSTSSDSSSYTSEMEKPKAEETQMTIVETAIATDALSTLVAAVQAGDLVDTLNSDGPFTVFAPTNAAFAAIQDTVDTLLLPENQAQLQSVLTYHVVPSAALSTDLTDGMTLTTVNGEKLTVAISSGTVTINGATVVTADVQTSNGVVHVIDSVLVPTNLDLAADEDEEPTATIVETAIATDALSTLVAAVQAGDLVDTLNSDGPFTVFAPTNAAFAAIQDTVDTLLLPENQAQLQSVLTYHVVPSAALSTDLTDGMTLTTVNGEKLTVAISSGTVTINGATVVTADVQTSNGVVHVIDSVLVPSAE